jgi:hypothetical protein
MARGLTSNGSLENSSRTFGVVDAGSKKAFVAVFPLVRDFRVLARIVVDHRECEVLVSVCLGAFQKIFDEYQRQETNSRRTLCVSPSARQCQCGSRSCSETRFLFADDTEAVVEGRRLGKVLVGATLSRRIFIR